MLGDGVELRCTSYDLDDAAERIRRTAYPAADEAAQILLEPPSEVEMLELYGSFELTGSPAT